MPFGIPPPATAVKVTDTLVRVDAQAITNGSAITIGLHGNSGSPTLKLPAAFQPTAYTDEDQNLVSLQDAISVALERPGSEAVATPIEIVKTGTTEADFLITITNTSGTTPSTALTFYVRYQ